MVGAAAAAVSGNDLKRSRPEARYVKRRPRQTLGEEDTFITTPCTPTLI